MTAFLALYLLLAPPVFLQGIESQSLQIKSQKILPKSPEFLTPLFPKKAKGRLMCVVLLVEFKERRFSEKMTWVALWFDKVGKKFGISKPKNVTDPVSWFSSLIFGEPEMYPFVSVKEYWERESFGRLKVEGKVFGPYLAPNSLEDWACGQANTGYYCGLGGGAEKLLGTVIRQADRDIDFSQFDGDGDGNVDCVILIHTGIGGEASGQTYDSPACCDLWSLAQSTQIQTADGVVITRFITSPSPSHIFPLGNMGVVAHEMGHLIGLSDIYDTGIDSGSIYSCGAGPYSLMAFGVHTGIFADPTWQSPRPLGTSPSPLSAWEKIYLGWASPEPVTAEFCSSLTPFSKTFPKIQISENEYLLFQFISKRYFPHLATSGIIIWHIDENVIKRKYKLNRVNNRECFPGCGSECGEEKDERYNPEKDEVELVRWTCRQHYGVRAILSYKGEPFRLEKDNWLSEGARCMDSFITDFWQKGDRFPEYPYYMFSWSGEKHNATAFFGPITETPFLSAQVLGLKVGEKPISGSPYLELLNSYLDFARPGEKVKFVLLVRATPPSVLVIESPEDAHFENGERFLSLDVSETQVEIFWQAPQKEGNYKFTVKSANCFDIAQITWDITVQKDNLVENQKPAGIQMPQSCSCSSASPQTSVFSIILPLLFVLARSRFKTDI